MATNDRTNAYSDPVLSVFPNPASDRTVITLPIGLPDAQLELLDAQGRSLLIQRIGSSSALAELDLRYLTTGLYLLRLNVQGLPVGECKLTIAR